MTNRLFVAAFSLGLIAVGWVGFGFIGSNTLALVMTTLIGAVYLAGTRELQQFRQATATLTSALMEIPENLPHLGSWLDRLHPSLQNPVRLRIEGERTALPTPVLTSYLVGLLVMLGMLGTFLGMVVTLNGAVFALEGTTDLQAIRTSLATPIKGLGLAFGTSVAGVAASAMLGLMSALCRRERLLTGQLLDTKIATVLDDFSLTHQRRETFKALQMQALALPAVVDKLQAMVEQMERRNEQWGERLLGDQANFHQEVKIAYTDLATAVGKSLKDSLSESARVAGESLKPLVETAMTGIAQEAASTHTKLIDTAQTQLNGFAEQLKQTSTQLADTWEMALAHQTHGNENLINMLDRSLETFASTFERRSGTLLNTLHEATAKSQGDQAAADSHRLEAWTHNLETMAATLQGEWHQMSAQTLAQQEQICMTLNDTARDISAAAQANASQTIETMARLLNSSEALVHARIDTEATWIKQHGEQTAQLVSLWRTELGALRNEEAQRGQVAVERLGELQTVVTHHLSTLGTALEAPITRLLETASEAPRAAAEVIAQLRQEISHSMTKDNAVLAERSRIMATLHTLLDAINHASGEQRTTINALVTSSAQLLDRVSNQFAEQVGVESARMADIAAQVTGSAIEVASLGESFSFAVKLFNESNDKLIGNLQRIEATMDKSMLRSDEQLAYYVAQAREIIDLTIMLQKEVVGDLHQLATKPQQRVHELG